MIQSRVQSFSYSNRTVVSWECCSSNPAFYGQTPWLLVWMFFLHCSFVQWQTIPLRSPNDTPLYSKQLTSFYFCICVGWVQLQWTNGRCSWRRHHWICHKIHLSLRLTGVDKFPWEWFVFRSKERFSIIAFQVISFVSKLASLEQITSEDEPSRGKSSNFHCSVRV